jgi:DNA-binding GntR family transcriptional regulator
MAIDPASFEPVYQQLARILRDQILAGELEAGARIGSEGRLAQQFGTGRDSVRDAMQMLRREGLVITRKGRGSFVREPAARVAVLHVGGGTRVAARVPTEDERRDLGIPEGTALLVISREGEPDRLLPGDRNVIEVGGD